MRTIRYGIVSTTASYWNMYVAQQQALYERQGIELQPVLTGGTAATVQQLIDERIDLAGCSPDEVVSAVQRGADLVVIGGVILRPVSWIVGRPGLRELAELRGARIGVNQTRGSLSIVLRAALRRAGLETEDYAQVVAEGTPAMVEALRRGDMDAAMLTAPFDLELIREGFAPLANVGEFFPTYAFATISARRPWVEQHADDVVAFFRATAEAGELIADPAERAASLRALATGTGLHGEALERTYELYQQPGVLARRGEVEAAGLEVVLDIMAEEQLLAGPRPRVADLLLPRWLGASA